MMNGGIDHARTDVYAKPGNRKYPESVAQDRQWDDGKSQEGPFPTTPQKHLTGNETGDEKHEARSNAAAFLGDLKGDPRELDADTGRHSSPLVR